MKNSTVGPIKILSVFFGTATLLAAVTVGATMLGSANMQGTSHVHPVGLLVDIKDLPSEPFIRLQSATATISPLTEHFGTDHFGSNGYALRGWGIHHNADLLVENVLRYSSEKLAKAEFAAASYGRIYNDSIYLDNIRTVDLAGAGLSSDSAAMGCVKRRTNWNPRCYGWAFRGRYGSYLVEIVFDGGRDPKYNRGLEQEVFLEIAKSVDRHIANFNLN